MVAEGHSRLADSVEILEEGKFCPGYTGIDLTHKGQLHLINLKVYINDQFQSYQIYFDITYFAFF